MAEQRRKIRKTISVIKGIFYVIVGFFFILIWLFTPDNVAKDTLLYIVNVLWVCVSGLLLCYWALKEFLSAYNI